MSCFCIGGIDLLAELGADLQASLAFSASAEAALALHARLGLGFPGLPGPPLDWPGVDLPLGALASLTATAQLRAQARASLGIDLDAHTGARALARLTATLNARLSAIAGLNLDLDAWVRLGRLNDATLGLTAVFKACLAVSARAEATASANASLVGALDFVPPSSSWGGPQLVAVSALASLAAQLGVKLDAAFVASLKATAQLVAQAMACVALDVSAAANLAAGFSAIAKLGATLGINPLQAGFPAVRAAVAANYSAMALLAAQLGISLSGGADALPALPAIPGLRAALLASLHARLQAAASASAAFGASASADLQASAKADLSVSALITANLSASLAVSLSAMLRVNVAFTAPCGTCDLSSVMAALALPAQVPGAIPAVPVLPVGTLPSGPGTLPAPVQASSEAPSPARVASSHGASATAPEGAGSGGTGDTATNASGYSGGGGSSGGRGSSDSWDDGGTGGGDSGGDDSGSGVPATVMTAQTVCVMGLAPSVLTVLPINRVTIGKQFAANIMDHLPMTNIKPFGMCVSLANPTTAAATAAALGVLTPTPCVPMTLTPWAPGAATVTLGEQPMLDSISTCNCLWGGVISIVSPGQVQTTIP